MDQVFDLPPAGAMIGRWSVDRYLNFLAVPALGAALAAHILVWLEVSASFIVAAEVLFFLIIGFRMAAHQGQRTEVLTAGAMIGMAVGFGASLAKFLLQPQLVTLINIISETLLTALIGSLLGVIALIARRLAIR
ncbi:MAG: hypothetical protein HYY50_04915 [Candidatus Kerfeldbacteria bacterium]|nr:hypothetical protein [Candidatus Kerfeldbacteria bacterium]